MAEGYDNRELVDEANTISDEETSGDYMYSKDSSPEVTSDETSSSGKTGVDSQDLDWHQIREYDNMILPNLYKRYKKKQKVGPKKPKCDSKTCIISVSGNFALYLCYVCNLFLCGECMLKHDKTHKFVSVESETDERRRMAEMFVGRMRSERLGREIDFDREDVRVHGRVNVKHDLDIELYCYISGLSGLDNKKWVAVDHNNYCIKIFCSVSNTLLRYIKFGSLPLDVTEIKVKQKSTDPDPASGSKTDISEPARDELNTQSMLAITFPYIKQIWFIDVNKTPAVKTKTIEMDKKCFSIDFSEDQIFALCKDDDVESRCIYYFIHIFSKDGNLHKVIHNPPLFTAQKLGSSLGERYADLAVHNGRAYYTYRLNDRVSFVNVEDGKTISELRLRGSWPRGISVDHNTGVVYVCGWGSAKVYKLSPDLRDNEQLSLDTDYTRRQDMYCFINNKLYISHFGYFTPLSNVVTVVQLLT